MVKIAILGTAQDAGIPHFGCTCITCNKAFKDNNFERKVSSMAVLGNEKVMLIDASPDITKQQHYLKKMFPQKLYGFDSILITHLHIGHYIGLVMLGKESVNSNKFPIYVTEGNFKFLRENKPFSYLFSRKNLEYNKIIPEKKFSLDESVDIIPFLVSHRNEDGNTIGLEIISKINKKKALYIPDIDYLTDKVKNRIEEADKVIFDGSFYSKNELMRQKEIPHPAISETVDIFGKQLIKKFYFTHFNHSNPVLIPESEEFYSITKLNYNIANDGDIIEF